ncbi:aminotransferase class III-fold pyridoxal phosphate-dependent enzyme, partial [Pseudomonas gingeri]|nr:aminotransferase class III-fold pyridoxal phosphate-dependent enzyme [Pseudomonas gingeri]
LCAQVRSSGELLARLLDERFANHPHVADIRGRGLFWAIELVQDRDGNRPFAANLRVHGRIKTAAQARGLLCYPGGGTVDGLNGDHVLLAPPYISTPEQLAFAVDTLAVALDESLATCPSTRHKEA